MTDVPMMLVIAFNADGKAIETRVPITGPALAQWQADQAAALAASQAAAANADTIHTELEQELQAAQALAAAIDGGSPTPAQQLQALGLCLHGLIRLAKVVYRELQTTA